MKVLGISPLDKDATASLVEDGRVLFAAAEERFSRIKQHAGFPARAIEAAFNFTGVNPDEIDAVAYPFLGWQQETELIQESLAAEGAFQDGFRTGNLQELLAEAERRVPNRSTPISGLEKPNQKMSKSLAKRLFYRWSGGSDVLSRPVARWASRDWARQASASHRLFHSELEGQLAKMGLAGKLRRSEHHLSHVANAYFASGFDRALVLTLDGYGSGLAGSISLAEHGEFRRLEKLDFPHSLGTFYETVTSSLGFNPDRHAGKIVGLAAYGDPEILSDVVLSRFHQEGGSYRIFQNLNVFFSRHLSTRFPMIDIAAAWQHVLEVVAKGVVDYWSEKTGASGLVLSGGVAANVKMNQRLFECQGIEEVFVYPNMGDGGCGTGMAMLMSWPGGAGEPLSDVYFGPSYTDAEIRQELESADLSYFEPENMAVEVARRIHDGQVIARFDGRMEYGPRALGNRSILYHAREPEVNQWLNKRLGRTEFMPFAPVTLWEERDRCYKGIEGAELPAQFMAITFDCTDFMKESCPAAVHVDGTARPQLIKREANPEYYEILREYKRLSGIPSMINTSFNMHEEPIVCSPFDAVRAFLKGHLDGMAIGRFFVQNPRSQK